MLFEFLKHVFFFFWYLHLHFVPIVRLFHKRCEGQIYSILISLVHEQPESSIPVISKHLHTLSEVTFPFTSCSLSAPPTNVIMRYVVKFTHTEICSLCTKHVKKKKKKDEKPCVLFLAGAAESDLVLKWTLVKGPQWRAAVWQPVISCLNPNITRHP